jgi:alkylation response protein AidB-like acyl-CoA dehydrogenase
MDQPGVEVRPIVQMTGDSEFSEVFFSDARTAENNLVGVAGGGWSVAMGTLAFERGASTLGQQMLFQNELDEIIQIAKQNGRASDPLIRQRIAQAWIGLRIQRYHALRTLSGADDGVAPPPAASLSKLFWATWHRDLGKLAMDVVGPEAEIAEGEPYALTSLQRMFLFTRSDTIYGGSNEIQRNIISERVLGLPRDPR